MYLSKSEIDILQDRAKFNEENLILFGGESSISSDLQMFNGEEIYNIECLTNERLLSEYERNLFLYATKNESFSPKDCSDLYTEILRRMNNK